MSASTTIRVVAQRNWMVEELRAAMANTGWSVQQHYGMSVPPADGAITWMLGAFAARLRQQGALSAAQPRRSSNAMSKTNATPNPHPYLPTDKSGGFSGAFR